PRGGQGARTVPRPAIDRSVTMRRCLTPARRGRYDETFEKQGRGQSRDRDRGRRHLRPAVHLAGGTGPVGSIVHVTINGERRELTGPLTVAELLRHLAVRPEFVAVELNNDLVTRSRHAETAIASGAVLETLTP